MVVVEASKQYAINNGIAYVPAKKVNHDKWFYQGFVEAYYRRAYDVVTDRYSDYLFSPFEVINYVSRIRSVERNGG